MVILSQHTVSEPESANSHARSTMIDLTCSNFTPKNSSLQQILLQIRITLTGATIINRYGDRTRNCTLPCSNIKDNSSHSQYSKNSPYRHSDTVILGLRQNFQLHFLFGFWCLRVGFACYANSYSTCKARWPRISLSWWSSVAFIRRSRRRNWHWFWSTSLVILRFANTMPASWHRLFPAQFPVLEVCCWRWQSHN